MNKNLGNDVLDGLKHTYQAVAVRHVHPWWTWALLAIVIGFAVGTVYVANQSGQFEKSSANGGGMCPVLDQPVVTVVEYDIQSRSIPGTKEDVDNYRLYDLRFLNGYDRSAPNVPSVDAVVSELKDAAVVACNKKIAATTATSIAKCQDQTSDCAANGSGCQFDMQIGAAGVCEADRLCSIKHIPATDETAESISVSCRAAGDNAIISCSCVGGNTSTAGGAPGSIPGGGSSPNTGVDECNFTSGNVGLMTELWTRYLQNPTDPSTNPPSDMKDRIFGGACVNRFCPISQNPKRPNCMYDGNRTPTSKTCYCPECTIDENANSNSINDLQNSCTGTSGPVYEEREPAFPIPRLEGDTLR